MKGVLVIIILLVTCTFFADGAEQENYKIELMNFNSDFKENGASISSDNLSLYFHSTRSGYIGGEDIFVVRRNNENEQWGKPENLGTAVNTPVNEWSPCISNDGLSLYFSSDRFGGVGGYDLWVAKRESIHKPWKQAENLGNTVNSKYSDCDPSISADDLTLYFSDYSTDLKDREEWEMRISG
jgi:peptidoglycan-associated lipoprotein